jgi:hypothetical protein
MKLNLSKAQTQKSPAQLTHADFLDLFSHVCEENIFHS